jgi:hypothetical protein
MFALLKNPFVILHEETFAPSCIGTGLEAIRRPTWIGTATIVIECEFLFALSKF